MKHRIKHQLHQELQLRHKEYFETELALHICDHVELIPAVDKVSKEILRFINLHPETIIMLIKDNDKIKNELYGAQYFGHLNNQPKTTGAILDDMVQVLQNKNTDLSQILQIHATFTYRIHKYLPHAKLTAPLKKTLGEALHPVSLFSKENRGRKTHMEHPPLTKLAGIARNKFFEKKTKKLNMTHIRALARFLPDMDSPVIKRMQQFLMPFVAGPSGHTGTLLMGAKLYGNLDDEGMKQYALACFAFLTAGGNHSFHEVMVVARQVGIPYKTGDYFSAFPRLFKTDNDLQALMRRFPELLLEAREEKHAPRNKPLFKPVFA